jgi:hypothetical protein
MTTVTRPPRPKQPRSLRLLAPGLVRIVEGPKSDLYTFRKIPSDYGTAYRVQKVGAVGSAGQDAYHVNLSADGDSCECKGHLRHGHRTVCRHISMLKALSSRNLI